MAKTTQDGRLLSIATQLPIDELLINEFTCNEALSELYEIRVELLREEESEDVFKFTPVDVNKILGQRATIHVAQDDGSERFFSGIFRSFSQIGRHRNFSKYEGILVPHVWKLSKSFKSRIFQHISVPDILAQVFDGIEVMFQLQRQYKKRNYCVQYQESDFDFASRVMEEEGIYYYFEHSAETERMVFRDDYKNPEDCPNKSEVPVFNTELIGEDQWEASVTDLYVNYELTSGRHVYRDHHFQLPTKKLETEKTSRFNVGGNQEMEVYVHPGRYARKYDGVDKTGASQTSELDNIFDDNKMTATNRMLANDSGYKVINGESDCSSFTTGYRFELFNHPNRELNGPYILTSVRHSSGQVPGYEIGAEETDGYTNRFTSIPHGSGHPEFRPEPKTRKPVVTGSQSAYVVGPEGEEIYTDEFGRIKVQFHWDRDGELDANSSCWLRVVQAWAGNRWGMMFIPRIGMEVIVSFIEGDPDQPVVDGCVYNPQTMPPYELPAEKTKSTIKSDSSKGGKGFNEIRFEDEKGEEQIFVHGEKDIDVRNKNDRREWVGHDHHTYVHRDKRERTVRDEHKIVERDHIEELGRDYYRAIGEKLIEQIGDSVSRSVGTSVTDEAGTAYSISAGTNIGIDAGMNLLIESGLAMTLKVGGNFISINSGGIQIKGTMVLINSGGVALTGQTSPAPNLLSPEKAHIADNADPGDKAPTYKNQVDDIPPWKKPSYTKPTHKPNHPKNKSKKSWIEIELCDEQDNPVAGERYRVTLPDGQTISEGTTDKNGCAKVKHIDPGSCKITFPELDGRSWDQS